MRGSLKREDDRHAPGRVERVFMVVSTLVTVAVFGYVSWHAWETPNEPDLAARVLSFENMTSGDVAVRVELVNRGGVGLLTVDVDVDCDDPPPGVTFNNMLADGRREATVVCPPGTTAANATVASWVPV